MELSFSRAFSNSSLLVHAFCGKYTQEGASVRFGADSSLYRLLFVHSESDSRMPKKYINKHQNSVNNLLNFRNYNAPSSHRNEDWSALFCVPLGALKRRQSPLVSFSELGGHASSYFIWNMNSKMAPKSINIVRNQPHLSAKQQKKGMSNPTAGVYCVANVY